MNVATIGTGFIVDWFLTAVQESANISCVAMFSRKESSARMLADKYEIDKIYTNLDDMLKDEEINFVYVASPNSLHFEHALKALQAGKNVICEKPFTSTVEEFDRLVKEAQDRHLYLFEAIVTAHMPNYLRMKEELPRLGTIRMVQCNFSQYSSRYDKFLQGETPNVFNPEFSGRALADINIYNLHYVIGFFGKQCTTMPINMQMALIQAVLYLCNTTAFRRYASAVRIPEVNALHRFREKRDLSPCVRKQADVLPIPFRSAGNVLSILPSCRMM